jgi:phage terminase small subunit
MKQRGRPSAGSFSVVPVYERPRPEPPEQLPEEAKEVWRGIVAGFRSDWFQGAEHLLKCYCEQVVIERQIADTLHKFSIHSPRYGELVRLYALVVGSLVSVATKLRLTPQSSRDSRNVKHVPLGPKPWELTEPTEQRDPRSWDWPAPGSAPEPPSAA